MILILLYHKIIKRENLCFFLLVLLQFAYQSCSFLNLRCSFRKYANHIKKTSHSTIPNDCTVHSNSLKSSFITENLSKITFEQKKNDDSPPLNKDFLLHLPSIFNYSSSTEHQLDILSKGFQLWKAEVSETDRSDFGAYVMLVVKFLEQNLGHRKAILLGENVGAVVALAVAARRPDLVKGVILLNSGTGILHTPWPLLASLTLLHNLSQKPKNTGEQAETNGLPSIMWQQGILRAFYNYLENLSFRHGSSKVAPDTILWRLTKWLIEGSKQITPLLADITLPVLAIASEKDRFLPSVNEVKRLKKIFPECTAVIVRGAEHSLLELPVSRFNLSAAILKASFMNNTPLNGLCPVMDWKFPSEKQIEDGINSVALFSKVFSPMFYSTNTKGETIKGLAGVPGNENGRRLIFVGNHQLFAIDIGPMMIKFFQQKNYIPRALTYPGVFTYQNGFYPGSYDPAYIGEDLQKPPLLYSRAYLELYGAVPVTPRNFYKLLQKGDPVLLYPGGITEALHGPGQEYQLFWPDTPEFVRMAAQFNATIVPFGAVGISDTLKVVLGGEDLKKIPFVGKWIAHEAEKMSSIDAMPMFRQNLSYILPFFKIQNPSRLYFKFGQPIYTENIDRKDFEECKSTFQTIKNEVRMCIEYLLEKRKKDRFENGLKRLFYEQITGETAPSFPINNHHDLEHR